MTSTRARGRNAMAMTFVVLLASIAASFGCSYMDFRSRVLWRVPSPDRQFVAVCQEVPMFDGPNFDVRLERPDGTLAAHIWQGGDSQPCSEMVWSPDGRMLGILIGHVSTVVLLNTEWARAHLDVAPPVPWRQFTFSTDRILYRGKDVRFVSDQAIEFHVCESRIRTNDCVGPDEVRRFDVTPPEESTIRR
jgi:hypothetical protein